MKGAEVLMRFIDEFVLAGFTRFCAWLQLRTGKTNFWLARLWFPHAPPLRSGGLFFIREKP